MFVTPCILPVYDTRITVFTHIAFIHAHVSNVSIFKHRTLLARQILCTRTFSVHKYLISMHALLWYYVCIEDADFEFKKT